MLEWAKREIEYALSDTKEMSKEDPEYKYYEACCNSALKAFEDLLGDHHTGYSISITKNILVRLIEGKPLTAITDTEDAWNDIHANPEDGSTRYQCKRMAGLFKRVAKDGSVSYTDVNRCICIDVHSQLTYSNGLASRYVDEHFPIRMPYYPTARPFVISTEDFCMNKPNAVGEFTHKALLCMTKPDGTQDHLCMYYAENEQGDMVRITPEQYLRDWAHTYPDGREGYT